MQSRGSGFRVQVSGSEGNHEHNPPDVLHPLHSRQFGTGAARRGIGRADVWVQCSGRLVGGRCPAQVLPADGAASLLPSPPRYTRRAKSPAHRGHGASAVLLRSLGRRLSGVRTSVLPRYGQRGPARLVLRSPDLPGGKRLLRPVVADRAVAIIGGRRLGGAGFPGDRLQAGTAGRPVGPVPGRPGGNRRRLARHLASRARRCPDICRPGCGDSGTMAGHGAAGPTRVVPRTSVYPGAKRHLRTSAAGARGRAEHGRTAVLWRTTAVAARPSARRHRVLHVRVGPGSGQCVPVGHLAVRRRIDLGEVHSVATGHDQHAAAADRAEDRTGDEVRGSDGPEVPGFRRQGRRDRQLSEGRRHSTDRRSQGFGHAGRDRSGRPRALRAGRARRRSMAQLASRDRIPPAEVGRAACGGRGCRAGTEERGGRPGPSGGNRPSGGQAPAARRPARRGPPAQGIAPPKRSSPC